MVGLSSGELQLLHRGLEWIGFKRVKSRKTKTLIRRFKSMFGENPVAINKLFKDCMKKTPKFKEKYAFMTLQWLFFCDTPYYSKILSNPNNNYLLTTYVTRHSRNSRESRRGLSISIRSRSKEYLVGYQAHFLYLSIIGR